MAGIFQASTGYRDPAKSMTVKALENRLKAAQEASAQATQMQQPISDPMQGYAYLGNILASGVKEGMAEYRSGAARDELAKIKAGVDWNKGPTGEQYAQMSSLDPEGADKIMQDWVNYRQDLEKQAKQQEFQSGERVAGQQFTSGERVAGEQFQAGQTEDQQQHAIDLATKNQQMDVEEQKRQEQAEIDKVGKTADARLAEGQKLGLTGEALQRYAATGNMPLEQDKFNTPQGMEQLNKWNQQVGQYDGALHSFERAKQLTDEIPDALLGDLQLEASKILTSAGPLGLEYVMPLVQKLPGMQGVTAQQVQKLMEYDRIVGLNAMTTMSQTLKGQSTDREMAAFLQRLAAGGMSKAERHTMIDNLMSAIKTDRDFTGIQLKSQGINVDPYVSRTQPAPATEPASTAPDLSNASQEEIDAIIKRGPGR